MERALLPIRGRSRVCIAGVVCNSSDLADTKKIGLRSDIALLAALGHHDKTRIVERLAEGQARQKELIKDLDIPSGTMSRFLGELSQVRLIEQERAGTHDPYRLVKPDRTDELLDLAAVLASELSAVHAKRAAAQAQVDARHAEKRKSRSRGRRA